jgi:2-keto-4-pentenoate hydratase
MVLTTSGAAQVGGALAQAEPTLAADARYLAELDRRPISPLRHQFPEISPADAYQIQLLNVRRRISGCTRACDVVTKGHVHQ